MSAAERMTAGLSALEARIAREHGRKHCVLVGHANTALYLALRAIAQANSPGEVIVPTITCSSVIEVIVHAGFDPVFADVDVPDATIAVGAAAALIGPRTRAILPIHIFGHAAPIERIVALAASHGIAVIEDGAPATGGVIAGRPIGSFGNFSLHSYGGTKIVTAGGGGALLADDGEAAAWIRAQASKLPPLVPEPARELLASSHRNLTHGLVDLLRVHPDARVGESFRQQLPHYRSLYLHALRDDSPIVANIALGLDHLVSNLAARREMALRYHDALQALGDEIILSEGWLRSGVAWRYTFLVRDPDKTQPVTCALRAGGLNVSNHYWSMAQLYADQALTGSTFVSPRLINLWVDATTPPDAAKRSANIVRRVLVA